jgi:hypothetical protein
MLLREHMNDHRQLIGWGQACLLIGLFLLALSAGLFPTEWLQGVLGTESALDFFQGLAAGMAAVLLGLSIVLNVRGLKMYRSEHRREPSRQSSEK